MQYFKIFLLITVIFCVTTSNQAFAQAKEFEGKVISVQDGDTLTILLLSKSTLKVRLAEIDAPEKEQPFGQKSKQLLSNLVFGKTVTILETAMDRYGRTVGRVYRGNVDVNLEMVKVGGAWAYTQYLHDNQIKLAEVSAKSSSRGLWSLDETPIPPWVWRKQLKSNSKSSKPLVSYKEIEPSTTTLVCAGKTRCKQMLSCEEAKFYLNNCGADKLDGDKDGKPCEVLCH